MLEMTNNNTNSDEKKPYMAAEDLPPIATVKQTAAFLQMSESHIYRMYHRGVIPGGFRLGRSIRFISSAVIEWARYGGRQPYSHNVSTH